MLLTRRGVDTQTWPAHSALDPLGAIVTLLCSSAIHWWSIGLIGSSSSTTVVAASAVSAVAATNGLSNTPTDPRLPRVPIRLGYLLHTGQSINLTCPYDVPFYTWARSDQPNKILSDKQWFHLHSVRLDDSGRYVCQAVGGYGSSAAEMAVRVIDPSSYVAQRECVVSPNGIVNPDGPCFLLTYTDRELNPTRTWGENIVLDCDVVTRSGTPSNVHYRWEVVFGRSVVSAGLSDDSSSHDRLRRRRRLLSRRTLSNTGAGSSGSSTVNMAKAHRATSVRATQPFDLSRFTESKLKLDHLTLRHSGEYRCIAMMNTASLSGSAVSSVAASISSPGGMHASKISRTFRLSVKPRTDGPIILGPRSTNETVIAGQDAVFKCQVNPEEHRSSTIRWGKSIDTTERSAYEAQGREVIQWAGGTFVLIPSLPESAVAKLDEATAAASLASSSLSSSSSSSGDHSQPSMGNAKPPSITGVMAAESTATQSSRLLFRHAQPTDAGRYVCSVLTEAGRDDHKFVQIAVLGSASGEAGELIGSGMHRLTVYIAVPSVVFFLCLCVLIYCLASRRASRSSRSGRRRHRNYYSNGQQTQLKSPSAASSSSIGVCRNGMGAVGLPWNPISDPKLRPSPGGTGAGTTTLGNSSTNGSNSLAGSGPVLLPTGHPPSYPNAVPGTMNMPPGSYPILLQSLAAGGSFHTVPDMNTVGAYPQTLYQTSTVGPTDYVTTINAYQHHQPGMMYPIANGHTGSQSASNSQLISSSPMSNETVEGRLLMPSPASGHQQPGMYQAYGANTTVTGANFIHRGQVQQVPPIPQSQMNGNVEMDMSPQNGAATMLAYHSHMDNSLNSNNSMRA